MASNYDEAIEKILYYSFDSLDKKIIDEIVNYFVNADLLGRYFIKDKDKKFSDEFMDVDFLKMKIAMTKDKFDQIVKEYKNYCFTVSNIKSKEIIEEILEDLIKTRENGEGYKEFRDKMEKKEYFVNDLVYWQNIRSCQNAGRYKQMMEDSDIAPYWQYIAIKDNRTRPDHLALNGIIRRYDDEFWNTYYPPNGFRCRCTVRSLSKEYLKSKLGLEPNDIAKGIPDNVNIIIDEGFRNNVGKDMYKWVEVKNTFDKSNWIRIKTGKEIRINKELKNIKGVEVNSFDISDSKENLFKRAKEFLETDLRDIFISKNIIKIDEKDTIYFDIDKFLTHLIKKEISRLKLLSVIKLILTDPDMILEDLMMASGKMDIKGYVKIGKIYCKKVILDGKEKIVTLVSEISKDYNEYFSVWTLYLKDKADGIIVYKK